MSNVIIEARKNILKQWESKTFFLDNPKFYYLENMRDVLAYLIKSDDLDYIAMRKYLEAKLLQDCYEWVFFHDFEEIKEYVLLQSPSLANRTNDEITVVFVDKLVSFIFSHLKLMVIPCFYPKEYVSNVIYNFFLQVKEELMLRPQEHGTSYLGREILNSWVELGVWYNNENNTRVHSYNEFIEDRLKADISDIIYDSYATCNYKLKKALCAYIAEKNNYDADYLQCRYEIMYPGTNNIIGETDDYDEKDDDAHIFLLLIDEIRELVVRESVKSYSLDDIDSICCPLNADEQYDEDDEYNEDDDCITPEHIIKKLSQIINEFIKTDLGKKNEKYFKNFLDTMYRVNHKCYVDWTFSFDLIEEGCEGCYSFLHFYLCGDEFSITSGGYEKNEYGGDSYTNWHWQLFPYEFYEEEALVDERLEEIENRFSFGDIEIDIEMPEEYKSKQTL